MDNKIISSLTIKYESLLLYCGAYIEYIEYIPCWYIFGFLSNFWILIKPQGLAQLASNRHSHNTVIQSGRENKEK